MLRVSHLDMESAKFKADVAERLHAARKALGMTQKDLADQADVPIPSLRDYERGSSSPGAGVYVVSLAGDEVCKRLEARRAAWCA